MVYFWFFFSCFPFQPPLFSSRSSSLVASPLGLSFGPLVDFALPFLLPLFELPSRWFFLFSLWFSLSARCERLKWFMRTQLIVRRSMPFAISNRILNFKMSSTKGKLYIVKWYPVCSWTHQNFKNHTEIQCHNLVNKNWKTENICKSNFS